MMITLDKIIPGSPLWLIRLQVETLIRENAELLEELHRLRGMSPILYAEGHIAETT